MAMSGISFEQRFFTEGLDGINAFGTVVADTEMSSSEDFVLQLSAKQN